MNPENREEQWIRALPRAKTAQLARGWWHVRGALWAALLFVCSVSGAISAHGEVRSALRATVLRPLASSASTLSGWEGWAPLGLAAGAGTLAAAGLRRVRAPRLFSNRASRSLS